MVFGEITTKAKVDYEAIVRQACKDIGYDDEEKGTSSVARWMMLLFLINVWYTMKINIYYIASDDWIK